jgi:hypothetical protein
MAGAAIGIGMMLAVLVACLIAADYQLVVRLRRDHRSTWEGLGSPSPLFSRPEDLAAMHRFLAERQYLAIDDADFRRFAGRTRLLTNAVYAAGGATMIAVTLAKAFR